MINWILETDFQTFIYLVAAAFAANLLGNHKGKTTTALFMLSTLFFWSVFYNKITRYPHFLVAFLLDGFVLAGLYTIEKTFLVPTARSHLEKSCLYIKLLKLCLYFTLPLHLLKALLKFNDLSGYYYIADNPITILYWVQVLILVCSNDLFVRFIFSRQYFNRRANRRVSSGPYTFTLKRLQTC